MYFLFGSDTTLNITVISILNVLDNGLHEIVFLIKISSKVKLMLRK